MGGSTVIRLRTRLGLALAGVVALGATLLALAVGGPSAATNCAPGGDWGTNRGDLASQVVSLVNQHRASKGLGSLSVSSTLQASSVWKSLHMARYGYFGHDDPAPPVARSAFQRARDCDYTGGAWGENIAYGYGSAAAVVGTVNPPTGWLGSPGHRANIENPSFTAIGVGVAANASGTLYWTQNFGTGGSSSPPPPPPPAPPPPPPSSPPPPPPPPPPPGQPSPPPPPGQPSPPPPPGQPSPPPAQPSAPSAPAEEAAELDAAGAPVEIGAYPVELLTFARAGARLVARATFVDMRTRARRTSGSVRCRAEVAGRRLRVVTNAFKQGFATCAWRVPRAARGKKLTAVVAVQVGERAGRRLFVRKVR